MENNPHHQHTVPDLHKRLVDILYSTREQFTKISKPEWDIKTSPEKWSKKEILGHLIDSASNNHQRFVRAQIEDHLVSPGYEQDLWVKVQNYQDTDIEDIIDLWYKYNLHLSRVIINIREENLSKICNKGNYEPVTLHYLIEDYITHLKHHLQQIIPAD
ncbi:DinB family protein [soil metagenome]